MDRPASGKDRVDIIERRQPNGSIYVYRRVSAYDREKGYYVAKEQKLLGKKLPGSGEIVPTRPKAKDGSRKETGASPESPPRERAAPSGARISAGAILERIGEESGTDRDVRAGCRPDTARKIVSLARYWLRTGGERACSLEMWQLTHPMEPYGYPVSEEAARRVLAEVQAEEDIARTLFQRRAGRLEDKRVLVYDTASLPGDERMTGPDRTGLEPDRQYTACAASTGEPVCFWTVPGGITERSALRGVRKELDALGLEGAGIVTECGLRSGGNLSMLARLPLPFLTWIPADAEWARDKVNRALETMEEGGTACPAGKEIRGIMVRGLRPFSGDGGDEEGEDGASPGDVFLHVFVDQELRRAEDQYLDSRLERLREQCLAGEKNFTPQVRDLIRKFLCVRSGKAGGVEAVFRAQAVREAKRYNGVLVLASDREWDLFAALRAYQKREELQEFFWEGRRRRGEGRCCPEDDWAEKGKQFIRFVAFCYWSYFSRRIQDLRDTLGEENKDEDNGRRETLEEELVLKRWLDSVTPREILGWFEVAETGGPSGEYARQAQLEEIRKRDRMFLEKLGVAAF